MNAMEESPECSDSSDSEKENRKAEHSTKQIRARSSKGQIEHMERFLKDNNESLDETMWQKLTTELNSIGPVVQSSSKWRRSWTVHKYNVKKQVQKLMAEVDDMESATLQDVPSNSSQHKRTDPTSIWRRVLELLQIINQKQDVMDKKIDKISDHIKKSINHEAE